MSRKISAFLLLMLVLHFGAIAQTLNTAKLDSFFYALSSHDKSMGSLAVSSNGVVVYQKAIGYSLINGDTKTPASSKTKYRIGSISKMFTGTMIFQLIEEGKLSLTTTLAAYYPQISNAAKITIGEMLSHHSGLHNFTNDSLYLTYMAQPKTEAEMLAIIQKNPADFEPGTKGEYSNTNFVLLGYIIEKVTGMPYATVLKKRIISKIGLTDTYYGKKTNIADNESYSYSFAGKWVQEPETDMSIPGGAGSIVSTPADLDKFIEALFAGKLVNQSSLEQMKTIKDGLGMAMFQMPFYEKRCYGHNGAIDGFRSMLCYFPEDKLSVAYISNGVVYPVNDVLVGILSIYFNKPYTIPDFKTPTINPADLDKYLGTYSSTQIHLKVTVTKNGGTLMAQATGQSAFPLEPAEKDKFVYKAANIVMQFNPDKGEFTLIQATQNYLFTLVK